MFYSEHRAQPVAGLETFGFWSSGKQIGRSTFYSGEQPTGVNLRMARPVISVEKRDP